MTALAVVCALLAAILFAAAATRQHNEADSAPKLRTPAGLLERFALPAESAILATAPTALRRTVR
ncbi:MAG: hypothetical protein QOI78_6604 [Actinomycetota bacterium]|nr:hypothetical protein [Actinomycetota bacterium]